MGLPKHWVSAIFEKFDVRYPHKWASGIEGREERAIDEWAHVLDGLTGDDIKHGFENWKSDWPPSVYEFLKACRGGSKNEHGLNHTPAYYHKQPERDRSHLLSSDERNKKRKSFRDNLHALANDLRAKTEKSKQEITTKQINYDFRDYAYMVMLIITKDKVPNIIDRIEQQRPGSFDNYGGGNETD